MSFTLGYERSKVRSTRTMRNLAGLGCALGMAAGLGVVAHRLPAPDGDLGPRSLVFIGATILLTVAVVVSKPAVALLLLLLTAFVGTRRDVLAGAVDTRDLALWLAVASAISSHAGSYGPRLRPTYDGSRGPVIAILALTLAVALSTLSHAGSYEHLSWWVRTLVFVVCLQPLFNRVKTQHLLRLWVSTTTAIAVGAIAQAAGLPGAPPVYVTETFDAARYASFFGHPNSLGITLAVALPLTVITLLDSPSARWRALSILALGLQAAALTLTASRAALLGGAAALILPLCLTVFDPTATREDRRASLVAAAVLVCAAGLAFVTVGGGLETRLENGQKSGDQARFRAMDSGLRLVLRHPYLGVGPGEFRTSTQAELRRYSDLEHAHNVFLTLWAETGIVAVVPLLFLVLSPFILRHRKHPPTTRRNRLALNLAGVGVPAAILVHGSVENLLYELPGQTALVVALIVACRSVETAGGGAQTSADGLTGSSRSTAEDFAVGYSGSATVHGVPE